MVIITFCNFYNHDAASPSWNTHQLYMFRFKTFSMTNLHTLGCLTQQVPDSLRLVFAPLHQPGWFPCNVGQTLAIPLLPVGNNPCPF